MHLNFHRGLINHIKWQSEPDVIDRNLSPLETHYLPRKRFTLEKNKSRETEKAQKRSNESGITKHFAASRDYITSKPSDSYYIVSSVRFGSTCRAV
jgi:hypothetical protein